METGLNIIFWYGILHALGPDHLSVIADFSIGKSIKKTMLITFMFACGHGLMLFSFAKLLQTYVILGNFTFYGDMISSSVIIAMGFYLIYMVITHRIQLNTHKHGNKEHVHIYFVKKHLHSDNSKFIGSAMSMGALMGIGGVRGMLVTLGMLNNTPVNGEMILAFIAGVSIIFLSFGASILYVNKNLLTNLRNVRLTFATAGALSIVVGIQMLASIQR